MKSTAMRKLNLFSAVLSLFLLVSASITRAQSVSIIGIVYQNNTAKIPFTVPEGKINVYLPPDIASGDVISGTVVYEPEGTNQKKKRNNLDRLITYTLFQSNDTPLRAKPRWAPSDPNIFEPYKLAFKVPLKNDPSPLQLFLKDAKGNTVSKVEMPLLLSNTYQPQGGWGEPKESITFVYGKIKTEYEVQKKVITNSENIVLQNSSHVLEHEDHAMMAQFTINNKDVMPVCSSPRQTIIVVPPGTIGKTTIEVKDNNGKTIFQEDVYVVDIKATIDKNNLQKNERTTMSVGIDGLGECPYPIMMTIVNRDEEIVLLDKGAHQTYYYDPFESMRDGFISPLNVQQGVTGVVPGAYNITANLILPTNAFGDVFHQQKSALKTPEDYNAWVDALKKDLIAYADKQGNDEVGKAAKANAQRAIDNISKCFDKNKLDELKAFADAYLHPVNIPKGAATMWVCGFEAYKAAIKAITGTLGGKAELIDWEVIKNGLDFIRSMGEQLKDEGLQNDAKDAKKIVEDIQKKGETKEKLQKLKDKLDELNPSMKGKISNDQEQIHNYSINDLQVNGFVQNFQPSINYNKHGNRTTFEIDGFMGGWVHSLEQIGARELKIEILTEYEVPMEWVKFFLNGQSLPKSGSIRHVKIDNQSGPALDFKNAFITEFSLPKMDATGKEIPMMNFTFKAEEIKYKAVSEKVKAPETKQGKQWMPSNFKIDLGDLPCKKVSKMESFKITQKTSEHNYGAFRKPEIEPTGIEYPTITFYIPAYDISPFYDWYNNFEKSNDSKNGEIIYLNENGGSLFSIPLKNVRPIKINSVGDGNYMVTVKPEASGQNRPDPVKDLIGYLDPDKKTLFVIPEYQSQVLEMLGAKTLSNGQYHINSLTPNRKSIAYDITVFASTPGLLYDASKGFTEVQDTEESKYKKPDTTFTDSKGTTCQFYKDSECGKPMFEPKKHDTCEPHSIFEYDSKTKTGKFVPDGKYYRFESLGRRLCEKGKSFCVEMYLVVALFHIYEDKNCTRLIDVEKLYNFTCQ